MRDKRTGNISLVVIICLLINVGGRYIAEFLNLPVWMDSFGTVLAAYTFGPFCGAVVGASANVISGIFTNPVSYIYAITSIAIGIATGVLARRGWMKDLFGVLTCSVVVTMVSIVVSTPLNLIFYDGDCGNIWGDGVYEYLREIGIPKLLASLVGEFYVDFLDKVITMMFLFGMIRMVRRMRGERLNRISGLDEAAALEPGGQEQSEEKETGDGKEAPEQDRGEKEKEQEAPQENTTQQDEVWQNEKLQKTPQQDTSKSEEKPGRAGVNNSRKKKKKGTVRRLLFLATVATGYCLYGNNVEVQASR
ncbi:MAG: ECF transporter S component, partial [Lachnospiraceae bacterium]|nr:ECF transporter S component [Lachnospiraceae bacterium]